MQLNPAEEDMLLKALAVLAIVFFFG